MKNWRPFILLSVITWILIYLIGTFISYDFGWMIKVFFNDTAGRAGFTVLFLLKPVVDGALYSLIIDIIDGI